MKEREVVLVNPNNSGNYVQGTIDREHLGLGYLYSEIRNQGFNPTVIDSRLTKQTPEEAAEDILSLNPAIVGFSLIAKTATDWCEAVAKHIKEENRDVHIVLGNYFPSLQPKRAFESVPSADSIVLTEGDLTFPELALAVTSKGDWRKVRGIAYRTDKDIQITDRRELIQDLDMLPFPEHYGPRMQVKEFAIEGSRGCFWRCTYCSIPPFFQADSYAAKWRARSPENIVREMKENVQKYPDVRLFRFVDPDFIGSPRQIDRLKDFIERISRSKLDIGFIIDTRTSNVLGIPEGLWKNLRSVGLQEVYLGVENASLHIKRMMQKGTTAEDDKQAITLLNKLEIRVRLGFMMITPWTKEEDIELNARALHSLGSPRLDKYFQEMYLVPGTASVELTQKTAKIWFDDDGKGEYYSYDLPHPINNLRRISRALTATQLYFLESVQSFHESLRVAVQDNEKKAEEHMRRLNDFSLGFFLAAFAGAKQLSATSSEDEINKFAEDIVYDFQPKLRELEHEFNSENLEQQIKF